MKLVTTFNNTDFLENLSVAASERKPDILFLVNIFLTLFTVVVLSDFVVIYSSEKKFYDTTRSLLYTLVKSIKHYP